MTFPASFNLADLNGSNGFVLNGIDRNDNSGISVSHAGDLNADGVDDIIIGAHGADPNDQISAGESYVVFGGNGIGSSGSLNLSSLNGSDGFVLNGIDAVDESGISVSDAGDFNADGIDDIIIGAHKASPNGNFWAGASYVVFGGNGIGSSGLLNLSNLNGNNGFALNGIATRDASGRSVSNAGDLNADGIDDIIIGAYLANHNGNDDTGASYVVFGNSGIGNIGSLDLSSLNGSDGFVLNGTEHRDYSGFSVSHAGDLNADGIDDIIIGAYLADSNGNINAGESYVVFGNSSIGGGGSLNLISLNGSNGFLLNGVNVSDQSGISVSYAGDLNADGVDDIIIGANIAPNGSRSGESYVVFGSSSIGSSGSFNLSSLNGSNGFVLNGVGGGDQSGFSVSHAGDVNADGIDDIIIGAPDADPSGNGSGESYVVFGGSGVGSSGALDLSSLNGSNGFVLNGIDGGDNSGRSVSHAGDVNADGIDDIIIGARGANNGSGESYVVFGQSLNPAPTPGDDILIGTIGPDSIDGLGGNDSITGLEGDDFLIGNAGNDTLIGNEGNDTLQGKAGDDLLDGGLGNDTLAGNGGNDFLLGGDGNDGITGGTGNDEIDAGSGDDTVNAGNGDDTIYGGDGDDVLNGGNDRDTIYGRAGNDLIRGGDGRDTLYGESGNDNLKGGNTKDFLFGGDGNDRIDGNGGADELIGGRGSEITMRGQAGDDLLIGVEPTDLMPGIGERDRMLGGIGADTFVVGDETNVFYLGNGGLDYADIRDFDFGESDLIQLNGSSVDYSLQTFGGGTRIFHENAGGAVELVAIAKGVSFTDFSSGFSFV